MKISVIIPTFNEAENIGFLIKSLQKTGGENLLEIIVVDSPNTTDSTPEIARNLGAIALKSSEKGRAFQMNFGAKHAKGEVLYFVHADTTIHADFSKDILHALAIGFDLGCYRTKFDTSHFLLKILAFFTRFQFIWCRGGDQTLFIRKKDFINLGSFREDFVIMEDYEFIQRANKILKFKIIPKNVIISTRKYKTNSYLRVQKANFKIMQMFLRGNVSPHEMNAIYRKMLDYR